MMFWNDYAYRLAMEFLGVHIPDPPDYVAFTVGPQGHEDTSGTRDEKRKARRREFNRKRSASKKKRGW